MIRVTRIVTAAAAVLALAAATPGTATARPPDARAVTAPAPGAPGALPPDWRWIPPAAGSAGGGRLVWTAPEPVPVGDARIAFFAGERLLGHPRADAAQRRFTLELGESPTGLGDDLRVIAAGRRLDAAGRAAAAAEARRQSPPAAPPAAPGPVNAVDPGLPGPYRTVSGEYTLPSVRLPGYPTAVEMRGTVVSPVGAPGKRPVALFLHGRHATCYNAKGAAPLVWPCPRGTRPILSHRGYLHTQKLLASQGHVTVSISANGINAQDNDTMDLGAQARSSLVRLHLARWAAWSRGGTAPDAVRRAAPADLSRVLLVGHSRGGEGVNRAALDSLHRPPAAEDGYHGPVSWTIRGTVLIGPTIFGQNPAPDVPSLTLLPGCDGDVSNLQGQIYVDGARGSGSVTALHSAAYLMGANHNYFNSEWTPGQTKAPAEDDFGSFDGPDRVCSPGAAPRLTATQQQKAGNTYIAAAARLFAGGDDRVRPLLDGSGRSAPSAAPARVFTHAVGGHRTPVVVPDPSVAVTGGSVCLQIPAEHTSGCQDRDTTDWNSAHFARWKVTPEEGRYAVTARWAAWSRSGTPPVRMTVPDPVSVAGSEALALRIAVPPNTRDNRMDVAVTDTSGRRAVLGGVRIDGLPGTGRITAHWAREVRVPLTAANTAGVDLRNIRALELVPRSMRGQIWLMDAWGWRPGTPAVQNSELPRVDLGMLTVQEGDAGVRTYRVPVTVSGKGSGQVRLFVPTPDGEQVVSELVTVAPGTAAVDVSITVEGNTRYGNDLSRTAYVKAVRNAAVGSDRGRVLVENDDPMPTISIVPVSDSVTEGAALTWRLSLSEPVDTGYFAANIGIAPVTGGSPELSTRDVDPVWLGEQFWASPSPERPLSKTWPAYTSFVAEFPVGGTEMDITVPTVADAEREPVETVTLALLDEDGNGTGPEVRGTVRDAS
ncbi:hypothetical protein [Streptomyces tsukubensis]|uniref:Secreted protein n=1 Tax=Streptomyces tsukubensis (strain DSM 42081 / NBRC 108919 / NRRL 18488 / 9993) TaxID=1114943 RepID=A0A7G3U7K6_STRT9|nr:hypothetical protein [Streptomyces tsukubensis]AZK97691.1 hypothetical protein B7R87_30230 [Streptomyces tsukubensis]QKM66373.1 hypothetical protein STSU_003550 [Streptomyces tsukubensis NRRL18488]TAI45288.1 hypothetical protein EWI31_08680 [Streptomyces tsukubensis]